MNKMHPNTFICLPEALQNAYVQKYYWNLIENIYSDIKQAGGIERYRVAIILENSKPNTVDWTWAKRREYEQDFKSNNRWSYVEDALILLGTATNNEQLSINLNRTKRAINFRRCKLRGAVSCR